MQTYQVDLQEYTPDYTLTPLTLFPRCNATDPEAVVKVGTVNEKLTNMKWYEVLDGHKKLIESTNKDYEITNTGTTKGQISMKKNVHPMHPVTLQFYAEYADTELTGDRYIFNYSHVIRSVDASEAPPVLLIDSPSSVEWNPCHDSAEKTITATVMVADKDVTGTDKCNIFWFRVLDNGALERIVDGNGDNDFEIVSVAKDKLVIDCNYIGEGNTYVCKASYDAEGRPAAAPDASIDYASTVIRRRIPDIDVDWSGVPNEVPAKTTVIYPRAILTDTTGVLPDAAVNDVFRLQWYAQKGAARTLAGEGIRPKIPYTEGMMLEVEVKDKGPYALIVNDNGEHYTDDTDNVLVGKYKTV